MAAWASAPPIQVRYWMSQVLLRHPPASLLEQFKARRPQAVGGAAVFMDAPSWQVVTVSLARPMLTEQTAPSPPVWLDLLIQPTVSGCKPPPALPPGRPSAWWPPSAVPPVTPGSLTGRCKSMERNKSPPPTVRLIL